MHEVNPLPLYFVLFQHVFETRGYLEKRNKYVWWIGFIYIYGLIDAIVDAHLHPFEDVMAEELGNNQNSVERKKQN